MGMNDLTDEEFWQLDIHKAKFYLENRAFMDFKFSNGQLCMLSSPELIVSWERFCELDRALIFEAYQCTDNSEPYIEHYSDVEDWNKYGRPYLENGLEYRMTLNVQGLPARSDKPARAEASKKCLTEWLMAHGGTEEELKGISWNGNSYSLHLRCMFTSVPRERLPKKAIQWAKKNPEYAHLIFKENEH